MKNEEVVSSLFYLLDKLRHTKRNGWYQKGIKRDRVESVADHIYGCEMLAHAMYSEFDYDVDINKVILMIALHEIGETIIGDITPEDMSSSDKKQLEYQAVMELTRNIPNGNFIRKLFMEFEEGKTKEAQFAYQIDKAECDLQARLYDLEGCFKDNFEKDELSNYWIGFDRNRINFDKNFEALLERALTSDMKVKNHSNDKIQNVISYYVQTNSLKDKRRTGEKIWNVNNKEHYGSIAEHIYSTQMITIITKLVYNLDIDIAKVSNMLSIHELGEVIGDDVSALLKTNNNRIDEYEKAKLTSSLLTNGNELIELLDEFNDGESEIAKYCKYCDKLAPDMISKIYDQNSLVDLEHQENNPTLNNEIVKRLLSEGKSFSEMWILYGQEKYKYEEPFMSISNYVLKNEINEGYIKNIKKKIKIK